MELRAGAATVEITPATPQWMDGYGYRTQPSEGSYQAITVKALALAMGDTPALVLAAEVLGFNRHRTAALKESIRERTGVPPERVILTASHTHCAPRYCDTVMAGEPDPGYAEWLEARCVEAAAGACAALAPVVPSLSQARDTLGVNRRLRAGQGVVSRPNPEGPRDDQVQTLWLEEPGSGAVRASLTVAATHSTCRGGQLIGGDYPGFLWRELEREAGGTALFVMGCAGDVRPHFSGPDGRFRQAEPEEVEQAGREMAAAVLAARPARTPVPCRSLRVARRVVEMPLALRPAPATLEETAAGDPSPLLRKWADALLRNPAPPETVPFEIQALALNPGLLLLFWPGEVVADYALWLKGGAVQAEFPWVMAAAYANGAVGYVPSAAIYPYGGYEVNGSHFYYNLPAPYAPDVEERLRGVTLELVKDVY